jgi:hypothetical protein
MFKVRELLPIFSEWVRWRKLAKTHSALYDWKESEDEQKDVPGPSTGSSYSIRYGASDKGGTLYWENTSPADDTP